jgi:beta-galactosidase/beta-glucuronidase
VTPPIPSNDRCATSTTLTATPPFLAAATQDVLLMRDLNFNAVRCSHYPTDEAFYSICDELGMYVVDEANIETHGMGFEPDKVRSRLRSFESLKSIILTN